MQGVLEYLQEFYPPIIHRDIKPNNIILSPDNEQVYVIDFGAVRDKVVTTETFSHERTTIIGTYGYMPPEQFTGGAVPASDIFAAGMTLITLLSRREPMNFPQKNGVMQYRPYAMCNFLGNFPLVNISSREEDEVSAKYLIHL